MAQGSGRFQSLWAQLLSTLILTTHVAQEMSTEPRIIQSLLPGLSCTANNTDLPGVLSQVKPLLPMAREGLRLEALHIISWSWWSFSPV